MAIKVNFSEQEASSEARSFDPIPSGQYYCRITDIDLRECGPESKNPGKPYWAVEFTVQDGEYENRKLWTNAMLFEGALYTVAQMMKAAGFEANMKKGIINDAEDFISKEVICVVKKQLDTYAMNRDGDGEKQWKNEIKGIKAYDGVSPASSASKTGSGKGSLLP